MERMPLIEEGLAGMVASADSTSPLVTSSSLVTVEVGAGLVAFSSFNEGQHFLICLI